MAARVMDEEYVEQVLALVERVPAGRVTTYGALADEVGRGGPRLVGRVMSLHGGAVPWWRVVRADGRPAECHDGEAVRRLLEEDVPFAAPGRVDLRRAGWWTPD
ncbi:MGMT family protein [Nocardioides campestrisoli]|uniref:MGMT family protein n=1 Tax=Nocardioides campestrisoli TaxID=2736757 RepID=UPI00359CA5A4